MGDAEAGIVGESALSMPDAEVAGIEDGTGEGGPDENGLLLDGSKRPSEILRILGVEEERGTGSCWYAACVGAVACGVWVCLLGACQARGLGVCSRVLEEEEVPAALFSKAASAARKLMGAVPSSSVPLAMFWAGELRLKLREDGQCRLRHMVCGSIWRKARVGGSKVERGW